MTPKEREAIQQALASTIELLNDLVSALNTVRGAAALMGEGLERVQEDLALLWQIYSRCSVLQIHFRQCGHRCGGG